MAILLKSLENREWGVIIDFSEDEKLAGVFLPASPEYIRKAQLRAATGMFIAFICLSLVCVVTGLAKMRFPDALEDSPGFETAVGFLVLAAPVAGLSWYFMKRFLRNGGVAIRDTVISAQPLARALEYISVTDLQITKNFWKTQWIVSAWGTHRQFLVPVDAVPALDTIVEELIETLTHSKDVNTLSEWLAKYVAKNHYQTLRVHSMRQ